MSDSPDSPSKLNPFNNPSPNRARYWKQNADGRHSFIAICPKCDRQVVLLSDSVDNIPTTVKCSLCVRESDMKRWQSVKIKPKKG